MNTRIVRSCLIPFFCLMMTTGILLAQIDRATVVGRIQDSSGSVLVGAEVQMKRLSTNEVFKTVSTDTGDFTLVGLRSDSYEIRVSAPGFRTDVRTGIKLDIGQVYRFDFQLVVGEVTQTVEVTSQAPVLKTESPEFGQVISNKTLVQLPLNSRDFLGLVALVPGLAPSRGSLGGGGANAFGFNIRGQRRSDNIIYMDGAMMTDANGAMQFFPNIDALQEFDLKTGLYGAQFGIKPGGQINAATKSGTNTLHGTLYEYLRNNHLDARNFFDPGPRPQFKRNQFGASVGGPIFIPGLIDGKDKAWFFFSYAGERRRDLLSLTAVVPTVQEKSGVFSTPITDPLTKQPFPNNTIPTNRINAVAQKLLPFWPNPNTTGRGFNFTSPDSVAPFTGDQYIAKMDVSTSSTNRWSGRFIWDKKPIYNSNPLTIFAYSEPLTTWAFTFTNVRSFSNQVINDASFHFLRNNDSFGVPEHNQGFGATLGWPNFPVRNIDINGVPTTSVTGFATIGDSGVLGTVPVGNWEVRDNVSFNKGAHSFKTGYHWRRNYNYFNLESRAATTSTARYTGNALADFLLGYLTNSTLGAQRQRGIIAQNSQHFFFQDDWKASSKLTVNLGLRYEYRHPWKDKRGFHANFDPATGKLFPDLQPLVLQPWETGRYIADYPLITSSAKGFLPRVGLAYRLTSKTVIRAGFGIYSNEPVIGMTQNGSLNPRPNAGQQTFLSDLTIPNLSLSDPFNTALLGPQATLFSVFGVQSPLPLPLAHSWGLSIQREFSPNLAFEIGYQGSETQHDLSVVQLNDATPGTAPRQQRRPYPQYAGITQVLANGTSSYNGLEMKLEKRAAADGLSMLLSYTWAKSIDTVGGRLGIPGDPTGISRNVPIRANRGLGEANIPSRLALTAGYELPFGAGKKHLNDGGAAGKIFGGWNIQGIFALQSGPYITPIIPTDILDVGSTASLRPNVIRDPNLPSSQRTPEKYFDTTAFATPPAFTYGNAGRSIIKAPGITQLDFALLRSFKTSESSRLEFRFEAFNAINHANFNVPGTSFGTPTFGVLTSALPGRSLQFGLKFYF